MEILAETIERVPVGEIEPHPENPNTGRIPVIRESIEENGFYSVVFVQRSTRRILAGEHRWRAAVEEGAEEVPVVFLDVDDDRAKKILAVDNRSARIGHDDDGQLVTLLQSFEGDFKGTGYGTEDLDVLLRRVSSLGDGPTNPYEEWEGMPEFQQDAKRAAFTTAIHFPTEEDAKEFFVLIGKPQTRSLWWPQDDGHVGSDINKAYVADDEDPE